MKRTIARLLCFLLAWSTVIPVCATGASTVRGMDEAQLRAQYPNARIIHVSETEYPSLARSLRDQGYLPEGEGSPWQLAQNGDSGADVPRRSERGSRRSDRQGECGSRGYSSQGDTSVRLGLDLRGGSGGGSSEEAAVVFVIIGTVVLVVWTLYLFKFVYDVSLGYHPCRWHELALSSTVISTDSPQHTLFAGLNYKTGILDGGTEFGISVEAGRSDIYLIDNGSLHLAGLYWLVGPTLRWRMSSGRNPHYLDMDFVAGSTEHDEMGLIAKADIGVRFGIGDALNLGVSWGAMNLQLDEDQGVVSERDQFHYLYGISMGYRF